MKKNIVEEVVHLKDYDEAQALFGPQDSHLKMIRDRCHIQMVARDKMLKISGGRDNVLLAKNVTSRLIDSIRQNKVISYQDVETLLEKQSAQEFSEDFTVAESTITPVTEGQKYYMECMKHSELVFAIGPAGTGKTLLAVNSAVTALKTGMVRRLILTRPAVEAGERLGFLPGDFKEKVNPYLRPLYDSLYMILGPEKLINYMERDVIEVAPLAYMRGRTLSHSFIILDEAQNTTPKQMQMFLTRFGQNSRCVVTGDMTQTDIPLGSISGLKDAERILKGVSGIEFVYLTKKDIVRHRMVEAIVSAYENAHASRQEEKSKSN
ncbi:MAG: PhoH family protein [Planctomycetota bacterium]